MKVLAWPARRNAARNPYQKLLYDALETRGGVEVVEFGWRSLLSAPPPHILHIHWPDAFLAAGAGWRFWPRYLFLRSLFLLSWLRGTKVVWTAHNLQRSGQRNGNRMARFFWPWFLRRLDGLIFMTRASAEAATKRNPTLASKRCAIIAHGHYGPIIGDVANEPAPDGVPRVLFFGSITRYKNVHRVLSAFLELPKDTARLCIRGEVSSREPDIELLTGLASLPADRAAEVDFENRFLSDVELVATIRDSDLIVFPYSDVLNSGAAIFALTVGRPLLASGSALFHELRETVGPDWVYLIDDKLDGSTLQKTLVAAREQRLRHAKPDMTAFEWDGIATATATFYRDVAQLTPEAL